VVFVTGHAKTGHSAGEHPTDWRQLAATAKERGEVATVEGKQNMAVSRPSAGVPVPYPVSTDRTSSGWASVNAMVVTPPSDMPMIAEHAPN
jgi:hypothetical protein